MWLAVKVQKKIFRGQGSDYSTSPVTGTVEHMPNEGRPGDWVMRHMLRVLTKLSTGDVAPPFAWLAPLFQL